MTSLNQTTNSQTLLKQPSFTLPDLRFSDTESERRLIGFLIQRGLWNSEHGQVAVVGNVAYLSGHIRDVGELRRLEQACRRVAGISDVDTTGVRLAAPHDRALAGRRRQGSHYFLSAAHPGEARTLRSRAFAAVPTRPPLKQPALPPRRTGTAARERETGSQCELSLVQQQRQLRRRRTTLASAPNSSPHRGAATAPGTGGFEQAL